MIRRLLRRLIGPRYKIVHMPMAGGYLACKRHYGEWLVIDPQGWLSVPVNWAPGMTNLFHTTEAEAGKTIDRFHQNLNPATIWSST